MPTLLFQVVEDVRLKTPSVAPRVQGQVADGDVEKINALSWLLDYPKTRAEAVVQVRHLLWDFLLLSSILWRPRLHSVYRGRGAG